MTKNHRCQPPESARKPNAAPRFNTSARLNPGTTVYTSPRSKSIDRKLVLSADRVPPRLPHRPDITSLRYHILDASQDLIEGTSLSKICVRLVQCPDRSAAFKVIERLEMFFRSHLVPELNRQPLTIKYSHHDPEDALRPEIAYPQQSVENPH